MTTLDSVNGANPFDTNGNHPPAQWKYVRLVPGTKRPESPSWQHNPVSRDHTEPTARGIHLRASGLVEVDDDGGLAEWLRQTGRRLPDTYTVRTASGALKRFYAAPPGVELRHVPGTEIPGVELRCVNHQAVAPGSVVKGRAYTVADGRDAVPAPAWLIGIMTAPTAGRGAEAEQPRRVAESAARREWDTAYGRLVDNLRHWKVNGWGAEAHAGLLAASTHLARLAPEYAEEAYADAFRAAGVEPDAADMQKIESALERVVPDVVVPDAELSPSERFLLGGETPASSVTPSAPTDPGLFAPVTRARFRNRQPPPQARYGAFGGSVPLFYAAGVHWLQGESESGKSWVALGVVVDVLRSGERAIYVDYEDTEDRVLERLEQLGVTNDEIERLVYVSGHDAPFDVISAHVAAVSYALLVVDGVTSSLSSAGLSGRDEQELTRWADALPRRARMAVCVDHVVKATDDRRGMAIGSQAKKSVVTGSSFEVVCEKKFGRGRQGEIVLRLQKDKPGSVRGHDIKVARLRFASDPASGAVTLLVPSAVPTSAGDFFGGVAAAEQGARVAEWVGMLTNNQARADKAVDNLVKDLRSWGAEGTQDLMRTAVKLYKRQHGFDVRVPEAWQNWRDGPTEHRSDGATAP